MLLILGDGVVNLKVLGQMYYAYFFVLCYLRKRPYSRLVINRKYIINFYDFKNKINKSRVKTYNAVQFTTIWQVMSALERN